MAGSDQSAARHVSHGGHRRATACLDYEDVSPRLLELNLAGALNGHVPITAIVSLIVVAAGTSTAMTRRSWRSNARPMRQPHSSATSLSTTSGARAPSASSGCGRSSENRSAVPSSIRRRCARAVRSRLQGGSRICPLTTPGSLVAIRPIVPALSLTCGAGSARNAGLSSSCWRRFSSLSVSWRSSVRTSSMTRGRSRDSGTCLPRTQALRVRRRAA